MSGEEKCKFIESVNLKKPHPGKLCACVRVCVCLWNKQKRRKFTRSLSLSYSLLLAVALSLSVAGLASIFLPPAFPVSFPYIFLLLYLHLASPALCVHTCVCVCFLTPDVFVVPAFSRSCWPSFFLLLLWQPLEQQQQQQQHKQQGHIRVLPFLKTFALLKQKIKRKKNPARQSGKSIEIQTQF